MKSEKIWNRGLTLKRDDYVFALRFRARNISKTLSRTRHRVLEVHLQVKMV